MGRAMEGKTRLLTAGVLLSSALFPVLTTAVWCALACSVAGVVFLAQRVWRLEQQQQNGRERPSQSDVPKENPERQPRPRSRLLHSEEAHRTNQHLDAEPSVSSEQTESTSEEDDILKRANQKLAKMSEEDLANYWDETYETERPDPEWSPAALEVRSELESLLPAGGELVDYECRATLCRVELSYTDKYLHNQFVHAIFDDPDSKANALFGGFMTGTMDDDPSGGSRMTGFLVKQGRLMVPQ